MIKLRQLLALGPAYRTGQNLQKIQITSMQREQPLAGCECFNSSVTSEGLLFYFIAWSVMWQSTKHNSSLYEEISSLVMAPVAEAEANPSERGAVACTCGNSAALGSMEKGHFVSG